MKSVADPRHQHRRKLVQELFTALFEENTSPLSPEAKEIVDMSSQSDNLIKEAAPMWPIERLNRVDLTILHLALFELKNDTVPQKVIIDEAVELAKEFGSENSASFVNGVLGTIISKGN